MSDLRAFHDAHGGEYIELGDRSIVAHYGRPERTHLAIRNSVGVIEQPYDILIVTGEDRVDYVDNVISNAVPGTPGHGTYGLLLDPGGRIRFDLYVYTADDRLLVFLPPGRGPDLLDEWQERIFIQDVALEVATSDYVVLGVTGPQATEKLASVTDTSIPESRFAFCQATIADAAVTIIPTDGLTGEESYEVVCANYDAEIVMDSLLSRGRNAVPFGRTTWETLTIEAGSPILETELAGELPNVAGIREAIDFEKGCYVGQEVVSRIENRGSPNERLVGVIPDRVPDEGESMHRASTEIGRITRGAYSPTLDQPIALGYVAYDVDASDITIGDDTAATLTALPFVEGSSRSLRLPTYPTDLPVS